MTGTIKNEEVDTDTQRGKIMQRHEKLVIHKAERPGTDPQPTKGVNPG